MVHQLSDMYDSVANFFPQLTYTLLLRLMDFKGDKVGMLTYTYPHNHLRKINWCLQSPC